MTCSDAADPVLSPSPHLSSASTRTPSSTIRDLLRITESPEILSLAGGLPAPECLPTERVRAAADRALSVIGTCGPTALQYGPTEGIEALRATVAAGTPASPGLGRPEEVVITTGSQQGLALVAHALVDPGTVVAVEDPAYLGARQVFTGHGAHLVGIPVDVDGLCTEELARRLARGFRPAVVSCVPNFSNPSGTSLAASRRMRLAELAEHYGFVIVEDDPYHALSFCGPAPPTIGLVAPDRTVSLGSASKVIAPGLRVGWLHAPSWLLAPMVRAKQTLDLHTPTLNQLIVAEILNDSTFLGDHLESARDLYARRARTLHAAVGDFVDAAVPRGGKFLWGRTQVDTTQAWDRAVAAGVAYVPGESFFVDDRSDRWLRLSFATLDEAALTEAAGRLRSALTGDPICRWSAQNAPDGSHRPILR
ncbi:MAG: PLP-dependent aminotransferase family protein [Acidimicrobiia bacterium]